MLKKMMIKKAIKEAIKAIDEISLTAESPLEACMRYRYLIDEVREHGRIMLSKEAVNLIVSASLSEIDKAETMSVEEGAKRMKALVNKISRKIV